jgi:hypothetical protein
MVTQKTALATILAVAVIAVVGTLAVPFLDQEANALNIKLGKGQFIHAHNSHINVKIDGFHIVR